MSKTTVNQVIQRAVSDAAFRRQLQREPGKALAGMELSADERAAITSGDPTRLTALGVDQRMSKAFGLGALGDVSKTVSSDATGSAGSAGSAGNAGNAAFADEATSSATRGLVSPNPGAGNDSALIGTGSAGGNAMFDAGSGGAGSRGIVGDPANTNSAAYEAPSDGNSIDRGVESNATGVAASAFEGTGTASSSRAFEAEIQADEYGAATGDATSADKAFTASDDLDTTGDGNVPER